MKASKSVRSAFIMVRHIGIAIGVLPVNFPTISKMSFRTVDDDKIQFSGYGGCKKIDGDTGKFFHPFIVLNLANMQSMNDIVAILAHEMLHVKQTFLNDEGASHNNKFRKDCANFAEALGLTYYHVNGYDKPSLRTFMAKQAKALKSFEAQA